MTDESFDLENAMSKVLSPTAKEFLDKTTAAGAGVFRPKDDPLGQASHACLVKVQAEMLPSIKPELQDNSKHKGIAQTLAHASQVTASIGKSLYHNGISVESAATGYFAALLEESAGLYNDCMKKAAPAKDQKHR